MLISMPTCTSTIFGFFQAIWDSLINGAIAAVIVSSTWRCAAGAPSKLEFSVVRRRTRSTERWNGVRRSTVDEVSFVSLSGDVGLNAILMASPKRKSHL